MKSPGACNTGNAAVQQWVETVRVLCQPDRVYWCDGTPEEHERLTDEAVAQGILIRLNPEKRPGSYLHRTEVHDIARVDDRTFICTERREEAGPTNHWAPPAEMRQLMENLLRGGMRGRTMYVVPFLLGPPKSPLSRVSIEITDSLYVVLSLRILTRMGAAAWEQLGDSPEFYRGVHAMLDLALERRYICHFPEQHLVLSTGSNSGGNAILSRECFGLRLASWQGWSQGWLAEHMIVLGIESPQGEKAFIAAAFHGPCGQSNLAMLMPPAHFQDWKVWTVGDSIAWMSPDRDGRLHAINPEAGYFGMLTGTSQRTHPVAVDMISRDTLFTNAALTPDGDVWWEGKDGPVPPECLDWRGHPWKAGSRMPAAHPNSRFAVSMRRNPRLAPEVDAPSGVPIGAIVFGARRATTMPLVFQSFNWIHGVYVGATMGGETTAAAVGGIGQIQRDPMSMLPFCAYNIGDYFLHWMSLRKHLKHPPRIFHVNWFRKDGSGRLLWPGQGENIRVLKWIADRCRGCADADETPLGWVPGSRSFDLSAMAGFKPETLEKLQTINTEDWRKEVIAQDELFVKIYSSLPKEIIFQRELLVSRL